VKQLSELKLTAHRKAWMKIHARKFNWTIERIREGLRNDLGEDVDLDSIRRFVQEDEQLPLSSGAFSGRLAADRQVKAGKDIEEQLRADSGNAEQDGEFDPTNAGEGKQKVTRAINLRRGQASFRKQLLRAYGGRCAITECNCEDVLEAAHILPYDGKATNHVQNGLLLRSDIHTLFDLGRIGVDASTKKVLVAKSLSKTVYTTLSDMRLRLPERKEHHPNVEVLRKHAEQWGLRTE
jgi:HNH endonuclease